MSYLERREKVYAWMEAEGLNLVMLQDNEERRDTAIRWLSGQPGDALLFLSSDRKVLLVPWDINMARLYATCDMVIPFTVYALDPVTALLDATANLKTPAGSKIEIPSSTSYPDFLQYVEKIADYDIICRRDGIKSALDRLRMIKDDEEIQIYRRLSGITNQTIDELEQNVRDGTLKTEADAAVFIEYAARKRDCEGTGFATIAAGAERSFGIHAFPAYTSAPFAGRGLSILDFGLVLHGYTSDVTMTFARGPLSTWQETNLNLVLKAFDLALSKVKDGVLCKTIAQAVDALFKKSRRSMPHGLGHGIGLQPHEGPFLRSRADNEWKLSPGMIFTIEPGLYDPVEGGCRFENDVLLTENGPEVLTCSRIVRL
ncbi:MAG: Xaa-Pro peptidase family protein [Spirochaetaceae bacterium]|jgi:Xaa-Pro dipeptidase|nr:Xaa-Pro peptidase family protein [Spirochaetaceae bacterium]